MHLYGSGENARTEKQPGIHGGIIRVPRDAKTAGETKGFRFMHPEEVAVLQRLTGDLLPTEYSEAWKLLGNSCPPQLLLPDLFVIAAAIGIKTPNMDNCIKQLDNYCFGGKRAKREKTKDERLIAESFGAHLSGLLEENHRDKEEGERGKTDEVKTPTGENEKTERAQRSRTPRLIPAIKSKDNDDRIDVIDVLGA